MFLQIAQQLLLQGGRVVDSQVVGDGKAVDLRFAGGSQTVSPERKSEVDAQRARLADIAERTPVTLTLKGGADIVTRLAEAAA